MENFKIEKWIACLLVAITASFGSGFSQLSDPLPTGWYKTDVGEPALQSVTIYNQQAGTYDVTAGGVNVWGARDEFHFIYFETEEDKELVVKILDATHEGWNGKAFAMIRSSLEPEAAFVLCEITPQGGDNRAQITSREKDFDAQSKIIANESGVSPLYPRWVKFVRQGKYVTGYHRDDVENAQWRKISSVKLSLKGKAYMGIGVCGGNNGNSITNALMSDLEVRDIENPYVLEEEIGDIVLNVGQVSDSINVTKVFGHYIGDYFSISAVSTDTSIATVRYADLRNANPDDPINGGEEYRKLLYVTGKKDGVATIKVSSNIFGYKMKTDFVVEVQGDTKPHEVDEDMAPPPPWKFNSLESEQIIFPPWKNHVIPGLINNFDFDNGGEGIAYHDADASNTGKKYRPDEGVDIEGDDPDYNIGYTARGEWLVYTVNINTSGKYSVAHQVASQAGGGLFRLELDGVNMTENISVNATGGWGTYQTINFDIDLPKGEYKLKYVIEEGGFNFKDMDFTLTEAKVVDFESAIYTGPLSEMEHSFPIEEKVNIVTRLSNFKYPSDDLACLYQEFNNADNIELSAKVNEINNTGKGSYAGIMFRESFDTYVGKSKFVSFSVGAYQGLTFSYRWEDGGEVVTINKDAISQPCWLILRKYWDTNGESMFHALYSEDNVNWKTYLKYPLKIEFTENKSVGGYIAKGGIYNNDDRNTMAEFNELSVIVNQPFTSPVSETSLSLNKLEITPNIVQDYAQISFDVRNSGKVNLSIYNSIGVLQDVVVNEYMTSGSYKIDFKTSNLGGSGIYILRRTSVDDNQFIKFIHGK